jgi:putative FmdB family regulatory protein
MPTYEYECRDCGHALEAFHGMNAAPLIDCPACGKPALKKRISAGAGLLFKGSGFYTTDYRSDSYNKAAKAEGGTPAPSKTEASPAPAAAAAPAGGTSPTAP